MKISGSVDLDAPRQRVWDALHDPAVLARTLPGCRAIEPTGPDMYTATVEVDVASVGGVYRAAVTVSDVRAPASYRLRIDAAGTTGTVRSSVAVRLEESGDGTTIHYDADATVDGTIGAVGQGLLVGVAHRNVSDFAAAVQHELTAVPAGSGVPATPAAPPAAPAAPPAAPAATGPTPEPASSAPAGRRWLPRLVAALVGAGVTLAGVLLGRRLRG